MSSFYVEQAPDGCSPSPAPRARGGRTASTAARRSTAPATAGGNHGRRGGPAATSDVYDEQGLVARSAQALLTVRR